ncbi:MAG: hypothetical protein HS113_23110 [Verrucomicrobiales bacterium]|nr:hypothetical protein [Verrucomicrobiales bacterium]
MMSTASESTESVTHRVAELERQFAELQSDVLRLKPTGKDWRRTVGMMADDEYSRSAAELGRAWRKQANNE